LKHKFVSTWLHYGDIIKWTPECVFIIDLIPRGNKKIDNKNKFNHDGGFKQKLQQKKPINSKNTIF
jgi:hypothetical protein